jgi:hypothetical protein
MTTFLIVFGLAVLWIGSLVVQPFGKCLLCRGKGNLRRKRSRRAPVCPLCHGVRRRQRLGSHTVHRIRRQVAAHWRGPR